MVKEFIISQHLDEKKVYVKSIIRDGNEVFRAFSDGVYFSQNLFDGFKQGLAKTIVNNPNVSIPSDPWPLDVVVQ